MSRTVDAGKSYSYAEMRARLGDSSVVIGNVLPRVAFEEARIPGSISLPLDEVAALAPAALPDLDQEVALYCGGPT